MVFGTKLNKKPMQKHQKCADEVDLGEELSDLSFLNGDSSNWRVSTQNSQ